MTLIELMALIRKHIKFVVILPVACALIAAAWSWIMLPNEYTAEVSIYALTKGEDTTSGADPDDASYTNLQTAQMLANDFVELAKNSQIRSDTARELGMSSLDGYSIDITSSQSSRVIKLAVTGGDPRSAALIANKLSEEVGDTAVRVMGVEAVNIVNRAQVPTHPSGPRRSFNVIAAFVAALVLAILIIILRDVANTTIRSKEDVTDLLGIPVIGQFPNAGKRGR